MSFDELGVGPENEAAMKTFQPHPNLTDSVNEAIINSELEGGAYVDKLPVGRSLRVRTRNSVYFIDRVAKGKDGLLISGHPRYCPEPVKAYILGSNFGGSMLKIGFVGRGMYMEFMLAVSEKIRPTSSIYHSTIVTSQILEVEEVPSER